MLIQRNKIFFYQCRWWIILFELLEELKGRDGKSDNSPDFGQLLSCTPYPLVFVSASKPPPGRYLIFEPKLHRKRILSLLNILIYLLPFFISFKTGTGDNNSPFPSFRTRGRALF